MCVCIIRNNKVKLQLETNEWHERIVSLWFFAHYLTTFCSQRKMWSINFISKERTDMTYIIWLGKGFGFLSQLVTEIKIWWSKVCLLWSYKCLVYMLRYCVYRKSPKLNIHMCFDIYFEALISQKRLWYILKMNSPISFFL